MLRSVKKENEKLKIYYLSLKDYHIFYLIDFAGNAVLTHDSLNKLALWSFLLLILKSIIKHLYNNKTSFVGVTCRFCFKFYGKSILSKWRDI